MNINIPFHGQCCPANLGTAEMILITYTPAPKLAHDAMMAERFNSQVSANGYTERAIAWNLCELMKANGWNVSRLNDGDDWNKVKDTQSALELLFNLDEAWLTFKKGKASHTVFFVLGEGETIVTDWSYADGDTDGFNAIMNAFDGEDVVRALLSR